MSRDGTSHAKIFNDEKKVFEFMEQSTLIIVDWDQKYNLFYVFDIKSGNP